MREWLYLRLLSILIRVSVFIIGIMFLIWVNYYDFCFYIKFSSPYSVSFIYLLTSVYFPVCQLYFRIVTIIPSVDNRFHILYKWWVVVLLGFLWWGLKFSCYVRCILIICKRRVSLYLIYLMSSISGLFVSVIGEIISYFVGGVNFLFWFIIFNYSRMEI